MELCHEELVLLVEHVDEALLFLLLLLDALEEGEGVTEGVASVAFLLVGVVLVGGFLEVVCLADDFEGLGGELFFVEFEVDTEQGVLVLACEDVDTCFDGDELAVGGEVGNVFEGGGAKEGYFTARLAVVDECSGDLGLSEVDGGVFGRDVDQERGVFHYYKVCYQIFSVITGGLL